MLSRFGTGLSLLDGAKVHSGLKAQPVIKVRAQMGSGPASRRSPRSRLISVGSRFKGKLPARVRVRLGPRGQVPWLRPSLDGHSLVTFEALPVAGLGQGQLRCGLGHAVRLCL